MVAIKKFIKSWIPPIILTAFKGRRKEIISDNLWSGNYTSWEAALSRSSGYDSFQILERCKTALLQVKDTPGIYERDGVLFYEKKYNWSLIACLMLVAVKEEKNELSVLDFGGSLGSTYFQYKAILQAIKNLRWSVVEQKHFVDCGKEHFTNSELKFYETVGEVLSENKVHCLLLSSVLQYVKDPYELLRQMLHNSSVEYIIIDRTGFISTSPSIITVQNVPENIYKASYPCWFFNETELLEFFKPDYELIADFDDRITMPYMLNDHKCYWKGFFFKKRSVE